jgi:diphthamide biosynthesis methyltransferase
MMTAQQGCEYLLKQGLKKDALVIGCAALGSENPEIKAGKPSELKLKKFPQCLILPGELNFKEEEALNLLYKK